MTPAEIANGHERRCARRSASSARGRSRAPRPGHLGAFGSGEPGDSGAPGESGGPDDSAAAAGAAGTGMAERMMAAMPDSNGPRGLTNIFQSRGRRTKVSAWIDRKSTRLNSSHVAISYAVFCMKKNKQKL